MISNPIDYRLGSSVHFRHNKNQKPESKHPLCKEGTHTSYTPSQFIHISSHQGTCNVPSTIPHSTSQIQIPIQIPTQTLGSLPICIECISSHQILPSKPQPCGFPFSRLRILGLPSRQQLLYPAMQDPTVWLLDLSGRGVCGERRGGKGR